MHHGDGADDAKARDGNALDPEEHAGRSGNDHEAIEAPLGSLPHIAGEPLGREPRLQELVGYGIYNGLIGHIDKHAPRDLLGDGTSSLVWDAV